MKRNLFNYDQIKDITKPRLYEFIISNKQIRDSIM